MRCWKEVEFDGFGARMSRTAGVGAQPWGCAAPESLTLTWFILRYVNFTAIKQSHKGSVIAQATPNPAHGVTLIYFPEFWELEGWDRGADRLGGAYLLACRQLLSPPPVARSRERKQPLCLLSRVSDPIPGAAPSGSYHSPRPCP